MRRAHSTSILQSKRKKVGMREREKDRKKVAAKNGSEMELDLKDNLN